MSKKVKKIEDKPAPINVSIEDDRLEDSIEYVHLKSIEKRIESLSYPNCFGCINDKPDQRSHMEEGGCLYEN